MCTGSTPGNARFDLRTPQQKWHTSSSSSSHRPRPAPSRATSAGTTSWSPPSDTSATCRRPLRTSRRRSRASPGRASGVNVDDGFKPVYVVSRDKKSHITKLKGLLKDADELYLATDEDREGEAIAWHLLDELKPRADLPVKRMVFHEITPHAIEAAVENPREIDMDLVEAQEARRILDRLYGYEVSPVLWKKVMSGLSAGRVQSVATRLVVDRERDRMAFRVASYWDLEGTFDAGADHEQRMFPAKLHSVDGVRVARGSDFLDDGALKPTAQVVHLNQARAEALVEALRDTDVRGPVGGVQAVHPLAVRAVPHDHDAAGGQPQARLQRLARRCRSRSGCTRTATSPTCAPTRPRCPTPP